MESLLKFFFEIIKSEDVVSLIVNWFVFLTLSFIIILSGVLVVTLKNIFHCALFLCLCFFGVAGIYILLNAEFIAAVQVLVYIGGIVVLILFAIMLTEKITGKGIKQTNEQRILSFLAVISLFSILCLTLLRTAFPVAETAKISPSTQTIGELLLKNYVLPFEVASIVLLVAIIGAIIFLRKEE